MLLWFGLKQAIADLEKRMLTLESTLVERVAAMENAADLLNRASARAERSGINQRTGQRVVKGSDPDAFDNGLLEVRRRRGGW